MRRELGTFNKELLNKKEIVLLTKTDLIDEKEIKKKVKELKSLVKHVISVSIYDWDKICALKKALIELKGQH